MQKPLGQNKTIELFTRLISSGKLGHAYLLEGEDGIGKKTLANYVCALMMCESGNGCGICNACSCINMGSHPDIIRISNGDKQTIGIDKIRELSGRVYEKPIMAKYKAIIIENAHLLTKEAQNAMLKLIEEPPRYAVFMLLCNSTSRILKTVMSRVTKINILPLDTAMLKSICPDAPEFMYKYCRGNAGELLKLKDDLEFANLRNTTLKLIDTIQSKDEYSVYDAVSFTMTDRQQFLTQTDVLVSFFRDCIMKSISNEAMITNLDFNEMLDKFCAYCGKSKTHKYTRLVDATLNTQKELIRNGNITMLRHIMLMKYWEVINDNSNRCPL